MPARTGFTHKAPEQGGINQQGGRGMQEIMTRNPQGAVEI